MFEPPADWSGEVLGPRQGALIDALIERLRSGVPLNDHDLAMIMFSARVLGLTQRDLLAEAE